MVNVESEYMGGQRAKLWTYLILAFLLVVAVLAINFWFVNPEQAQSGIDAVAGLPAWAFPLIVVVVGVGIYWFGLKIEADWPEALGAFLIAGAVAGAEVMIGWTTFQIGGVFLIPYLIPIIVFIILMGYSMMTSK